MISIEESARNSKYELKTVGCSCPAIKFISYAPARGSYSCMVLPLQTRLVVVVLLQIRRETWPNNALSNTASSQLFIRFLFRCITIPLEPEMFWNKCFYNFHGRICNSHGILEHLRLIDTNVLSNQSYSLVYNRRSFPSIMYREERHAARSSFGIRSVFVGLSL